MIKNFCKTEKWSLKEISDAIAGISLRNSEHEDKRIVIPRFQRGKRWTPEQEDTLIDSIKSGYPIGTLLFYKTTEIINGKSIETYSLVDGLQRSTAIYNYISNPMIKFKENEVNEEMLTEVFNILSFNENQQNIIKNKVRSLYVDFIKSLKSFKNVQAYSLAKLIANSIPTIKSKDDVIDELVEVLPKYILETTNDFEAIASTFIPAVIYSGPESNLSIIFDRINSQGTPLDEYEAYAASWPSNQKYVIKSNSIIEHLLTKYDILNDDIYTIKDYDRDEIRKSKKLTLFEFVFGYGKYLNENSLIDFEKNVKKDEISKMGFELLGLCYLESKKKIGELHKELIKVDLNKLVIALDDCMLFVESLIKPMIRFKGNKRKESSRPIYSQNQILSMIAFVFKEKYDKYTLQINDGWKINMDKIKNRLPYHFVFDMLDGFWDQGGQKPYTVLSEKRYYEEISPSAWESCLNNMFENGFKRKESENKRIANPSNADIIFLNCIYKNKFSAADQLSTERFDIEHIATKDLLKRLIKKTDKDEGLPISCIANLCYLPEYTNRSKKGNTFYQDKSYLQKSLILLNEIESKYSFTEEEDLDWVSMEYEKQEDYIVLKECYLEFLKNRFAKLKNEFYSAMKIEKEKISVSQVKIYDEQRDINHSVNKNARYEFMLPSLTKKFGASFIINKGVANSEGAQTSILLTYSKKYKQGDKHKYWFAFRPHKVEELTFNNKYCAFACREDDLIFLISLEEIKSKVSALNVTEGEKEYYHIILFIDESKKVTWLLSKPNIKEIEITNCCIKV